MARKLRQRLVDAIRALAEKQKHPKHRQMLIDLSCNVDASGPIDQSKLPVKPDGFAVKVSTQLRHRGIATAVLCELQVVSMAMTHYWLYVATQDPQDARSCSRYLDWLEEYLKAPKRYVVIQGTHLERYLYTGPMDRPHLPDWLKEDDGETV